MYMCVMGVNFVSVSTILRLDFRTVPTVWYFLFFILFISKNLDFLSH
jgi:hypothetical protein